MTFKHQLLSASLQSPMQSKNHAVKSYEHPKKKQKTKNEKKPVPFNGGNIKLKKSKYL